jgi:hypothetical protein
VSAHEADAGEQHGDADDDGEQGTFSAKYKVYSALVSAVSVTPVAGALLCGEPSGPFAAGARSCRPWRTEASALRSCRGVSSV